MSGKLRVVSAWLTVAALGLLAAVVRVLLKPSLPPPRWDVLVCLVVAAVGVGGCLSVVRRGPFPVPGGVGTRRRWWPEGRRAWKGAGMYAWGMTLLVFVSAVLSYSPAAWRIVDAGHTIRLVEVQKVLSSEFVKKPKRSGHYVTEVQVSVPFDDGKEPAEGNVSSTTRVEPGDRVWALYAPSSASAGVFLDADRESLEIKVGASASPALSALALAWMAGCLLFALAGGRSVVTPGLRAGGSRSLAVTAVGGRVARHKRPPKGVTADEPKPCLGLEGIGGERLDLFMDPAVEPVTLAQHLSDSRTKLYWGRGARPEPQGASAAQAVLVVDGARYVRGWVESSDGSDLPEGSPVPAAKHLPEGRALRAIRTFPVWEPALHSGGLWALLISLSALGITMFGVGTVMTIILAVVAFLAPGLAWANAAGARREQLDGLLPAAGSAADPVAGSTEN